MRKNRLFLLLILILLLTQTASSQVFFRQHWAEFDKITNNNPHDTRWRVNDAELSLHPTFGRRTEARINGLMLLNVPEDLFGLERAELYLELWGGHPLTENKRFILNGKGTYFLPDDGTEEENCAYTYPLVPVNIEHLVSGLNAFQFACDRGKTFWGHFIIDNASVRCYLKPDHPDLLKNNLQDFTACVTPANPDALGANVALSLSVAEEYVPQIVSVDYFARFSGFADNGLLTENSWHGFTQGREFKNHVGRSVTAPFKVNWDTRMIPDQSKSMAVRALVTLNSGIKYRTPVTDGLIFPRNRPRVMLFYCTDLPRPFWSRDKKESTALMLLPGDLDKVESAVLYVRIWDGGEGEVEEPFKINGHAYPITSGKAIHDVVFTRNKVDIKHLKAGENEMTLLSDTEHHGIEILLPGPCVVLKYK